ncbi:hypothetical protein JZU54_06610, partial [bacterium]|nr:hypothetical protein [bacterium]
MSEVLRRSIRREREKVKVARRSLEKFGECAVGRMTEVDVSRGAVEDRGPARLNISLASIETPFTADLWPGE